ncbi:MAG: lytic transglycosylase domain-containing protein [Solirubrobacteraceae bacterium]
MVLLGVVSLTAVAWKAVVPGIEPAVTEIRLPLRHEDIIRQQARDKSLDPALVAAVIYAESRFRDQQESSAGALGLMQVTPDTASDIAKASGGSAFVLGDLHTPQVNIAYGTYRLRQMMDRFDDQIPVAVAAYNAGPENAKVWLARDRAQGRGFTVADIPFAETRHYVDKVLDAREDYRRTYPSELGLD